MSALVLRPYQLDLVEQCNAAWEQGTRSLLLQLSAGGGKCLALGTPVIRFDGVIVPVEAVREGDLLMGPDSAARRVLGVNRGYGALYRITPMKGGTWICNDVHVLTLVHTETGDVIDIGLQSYLTKSKSWRHRYKLFMPPAGIDFPSQAVLPIDPYFLGVWFGDGTKTLRVIAVSKPDAEIETLMFEIARAYGLRVRTERYEGKCPTHYLVGNGRVGGNPLLNVMRQTLENNPFVIPHEYQTASRRDREAFLAGILDTDGYLDHGGFEVVQKHLGIAEGITFVARSLGFRVCESTKIVNGDTYIRLWLSGDFSAMPLRIPRKRACPRRQKKSVCRTGFTVEPIGNGEYAGFELDGDGRFLLGDFTVTHNTATSSEILRRATALGYRAIFCAHLDALIDDTHDRLARAGIRAGYVQAGRPSDPTAAVQVCSLQTLHSRGERPPADFVILDEAHRAGAPSVRAMLDAYPGAALLGLSATPQRGDGRPLDIFERLIQGPSSRWLTAQGYLVPYDLFAPPGFCERELAADPVVTYLQRARGKRALVFATSVAHAESLTREFNRRGCTAACVTGTTSRTARRSARERMRSGELLIIVGVGVFIEGWDEPTVEAIIFARRFGVLAPWIQGNGRGLRPAVGKSRCTIFDLVGNVLVHGLPDDLVEWSLEGAAFRRVEARVALRHCKECLAVFRPQAQCPGCGARVTNTTAPKLPLVLRRAERLENYVALPQSERDARYLARLRHVARHQVRVPEWRIERWALERFQNRFSRLPEMPAANDNGHTHTQLPELPAANDNGRVRTPRKENAA